MAEELGERTENATPRRLSEARKKGQIARSQDLSSAVNLIGAAVALAAFASTMGTEMVRIMRRVLSGQIQGDPVGLDSIVPAVMYTAQRGLWMIVPLFLILAVIAYLGQFLQVRWLITLEPIKPKLTNLNPAAGLRKLFTRQNLVKTLVNTIKLVAVGTVAILVMRRHEPKLAALVLLDLPVAARMMALLILELVAWLLVLMLLIGIVDYLYQRWQHQTDLKMTRQEVKDERKSMEGNPEVRKRRMKMAVEIAMQRIKTAVPDADVVVTNPTHFSVAIRYASESMNAPRVVAKGADLLAFRIREIARAHAVPIVERPPLARALYWGVEVGQEVRPEHYEAVAEILAYVYRMEGRGAA